MEEKLKNVFEKEYSENKLEDFLIKTKKVYNFFGRDFKLKPKEIIKKDFYGGKVWLNEYYVNSFISNLEIITFDMAYPKILSKIVETNLDNFNEVYSKLIEIYYRSEFDKLKEYINMAYGCLQNPNCMIYSNNIHLIPNRLNKILSDISSEFKGHVIYVDTNKIFFRNFDEIRERFEKYFQKINKFELTYLTEKSKFGLFLGKKHYLIEENGMIKIKGIKHLNKDGVCKGGLIEIK